MGNRKSAYYYSPAKVVVMSGSVITVSSGSEITLTDGTKVIVSGNVTSILQDELGHQAFIDQFGSLTTTVKKDEVAVQFQYSLSTEDVALSGYGNGGSFQSGSSAYVTSSVDTDGIGQVQSLDYVRYRPGHEVYSFFTTLFHSGANGSHQSIGLFDDGDGFYLHMSGTCFGVGKRKNKNDIFVSQSSFNRDTLDGAGPSKFDLDATKYNVYGIFFGWLGASPIEFKIKEEAGRWITFHSINYPNLYDETSINNPVLPIRARVEKTSGAENIQLKTSSWNGGIYGSPDLDLIGVRYFSYVTGSVVIPANQEVNVFTLRSKSTYQNITNKVRTEVISVGFVSDGNKAVRFLLRRNATVGGTPAYSDIDADNSVIEYALTGSVVTGGTVVDSIPLAKVASSLIRYDDYRIFIRPNETLSVTAKSSATSELEVSIRWLEKF
jgi:hypothetical protein